MLMYIYIYMMIFIVPRTYAYVFLGDCSPFKGAYGHIFLGASCSFQGEMSSISTRKIPAIFTIFSSKSSFLSFQLTSFLGFPTNCFKGFFPPFFQI